MSTSFVKSAAGRVMVATLGFIGNSLNRTFDCDE